MQGDVLMEQTTFSQRELIAYALILLATVFGAMSAWYGSGAAAAFGALSAGLTSIGTAMGVVAKVASPTVATKL